MKSRYCIYMSLYCFIALHYIPAILAKPIIGILGLPNPQQKTNEYLNDTVGETYVRYIEASGANTVAIHPWFTEAELDDILSKINGVIFQGGGVPLGTTSQYDKTVKHILTKSKEYFDKGDHFPVMGICLGFESILIVEANDKSILGYFSDSGQAHPSILTEQTEFSRLYALFTEQDFDLLENEDSTHHFHIRGVGQDAFNTNAYLKENYHITLLANDLNEKTFISSFEGKKFPIYGLQYHPEKTPYNRAENYPLKHTSISIKVSELLGFHFVNEAMKSKHKFDYSSNSNESDKYDYIYTYKRGNEVLHDSVSYYYARNSKRSYDNVMGE